MHGEQSARVGASERGPLRQLELQVVHVEVRTRRGERAMCNASVLGQLSAPWEVRWWRRRAEEVELVIAEACAVSKVWAIA